MDYRQFAQMGNAPQDVVKTYYAHLYDELQDVAPNPIPEGVFVYPLGSPNRTACNQIEDRGKSIDFYKSRL